MSGRAAEVLQVLDAGCESFAFPMLDNGYFYLAATRLSLFRSAEDWAVVFELFGFSPREGTPSTVIQTFASRLRDRDPPERYVTRAAYERYLANKPHEEFRSTCPLGQIDWAHAECVAEGVGEVTLRGHTVNLPGLDEYERHGIELLESDRVRVFEVCRYLAAIAREEVLATSDERRVSVFPEMEQVLLLEEWQHPNVVAEERPSRSRTFQQLAKVLETGQAREYAPKDAPNTDWRNWPDGGSL